MFSNSAVQYELSAAVPRSCVAATGEMSLALNFLQSSLYCPCRGDLPCPAVRLGEALSPSSSLSSHSRPREIPRRSALCSQRLQQHSFGSRVAMGEQSLITPKAQSGSPRSHPQRERKVERQIECKWEALLAWCMAGVSGKTLQGPRLMIFPCHKSPSLA